MDPKRLKSGPSGPDDTPAHSPFRKRVTANDVARAAGVSRPTVSIVLSDRQDIAIPDATRARVKEAADKLGYVPSLLGRGFLQGKSKLVGMLILMEVSDYILQCISGIQAKLAEEGYAAIVLSASWRKGYSAGRRTYGNSPHSVQDLEDVRRLLGYQVDGVLFLSNDAEHVGICLAELSRRDIPVVIIGRQYEEFNIDGAGTDLPELGRTGARHLLSINCESYVFVDFASPWPYFRPVVDNFTDEIKKAGRGTCQVLHLDSNDPEDSARALAALVRERRGKIGIMAITDYLAAFLLQAAFAQGVRVPEDVAILGMGGTNIARYNMMPISSVTFQASETGRTAVELMVKRINGYRGPKQTIRYKPGLDIRQSTVAHFTQP